MAKVGLELWFSSDTYTADTDTHTHRLLLLMMIISEYWISLPLHSLSHCMLFHYPTWKPLTLPFSLPPSPFLPVWVLTHVYAAQTHIRGRLLFSCHHLQHDSLSLPVAPIHVLLMESFQTRTHTHTHTHARAPAHTRCPLDHPITHSETPVTNTSWSLVTNKKSLETDRLLCSSDLLSGVCSLSLSPLL